MEYADGGDLQGFIDNLKKNGRFCEERRIWEIMRQLLSGLSQLHSLKVVHRDIKCANVFMSGEIAKLGDMNVSKIAKMGIMRT